ncbi:solute carrier family 2, facilitated glucose transporter member 3 isoform X2 [Nematostella vectensis]|uniref:solute carrier family 2, facilitated glucose transporter member 3 isoform X1 n=1 Tax=Nematostella vectensis TaxID=45351 RepID=UPI0020777585|nr:solute carrier family 2, facilitated glucose transporter member 3 isoform X1 [Nematostella vectensis]XP_048578284.1 solute carrier family 2, facilitated glucose transporter member 3 isoform X2 [Nematostella vectensis]
MDEEEESTPLHIQRDRRSPWTGWLIYATAVAVLGSSFQFGYNSACINSPVEDIKKYFKTQHKPLATYDWSIIVGIFPFGGMLGALVGPTLSNIIGRKRCLLYNNFIAAIGSISMIVSYYVVSSPLLIIGRIFIGINAGLNTAVVPIYLSEISPIQLRGSLGTLNQFGICFGILLGYIFGLKEVLGSGSKWPWLIGFSIVPAIIQMMTLPFCPRSPRYLLLKRNKEADAVHALQILRGTNDVSEDIAEMRIEQEQSLREPHVSVTSLFRLKHLRMPLLIGVVMQMSQQLSGINSVIYYSTTILDEAHIPGSRYATLGVGIISLIMTGVVVRLVEVLGRRTLMLWGLGGMCIMYGVITLGFSLKKYDGMDYVAVIGMIVLVIFFQLGPGPIPWFITAEIFSQGPRPAACTVAAVVNWLSNFIIGIGFPSLQKALDPYTFIVFLVLVLGFWLFTYFLVPETKGRSIDDITRQFRGDSHITLDYSRLSTDDEGDEKTEE